MQQISMVGNELVLDKGLAFAAKQAKAYRWVCASPTLKLDKITVGGTA